MTSFKFSFFKWLQKRAKYNPNGVKKATFLNQIKSNLLLYTLYYAEACNEFAGPISASLRPGNTAPFEVVLQRWQAVGNTLSDLTGPRFEPQTSRARDERVTARPTGRSKKSLRPQTLVAFGVCDTLEL